MKSNLSSYLAVSSITLQNLRHYKSNLAIFTILPLHRSFSLARLNGSHLVGLKDCISEVLMTLSCEIC